MGATIHLAACLAEYFCNWVESRRPATASQQHCEKRDCADVPRCLALHRPTAFCKYGTAFAIAAIPLNVERAIRIVSGARGLRRSGGAALR